MPPPKDVVQFLLRHFLDFIQHKGEFVLVHFPDGVGIASTVAVVTYVVIVAEFVDEAGEYIRTVVEALGVAVLNFVLFDNCCSKSHNLLSLLVTLL